MRRDLFSRLPLILVALFLASCEDEPNLLDPDTITPSMGRFDGIQDATASRITRLLEAIYPDGGLENAAISRWSNVQRQWERGQETAAQAQMRTLAEEVSRFYEQDRLEAPDPELYPDLPSSVGAAVAETVTWLYVFVGLEAGDALEEFPEALPEDVGVGLVDPDEGGTVTTGNGWAAVISEPDATSDPVFVTIELLDDETCETADPLTQAQGCWDIDRYPEEAWEEPVTVEICVADNPAMSDDEWNLLLVHHKDEVTGEITALPWAEPANIDCTGFGEETEPTASPSPIASALRSVGRGFASLLLPDPLAGKLQALIRPPRGIGGLGTEFSEFFGAVPENAQPNLVSWWPADGSFFEYYGENHGIPGGDVTFETGIFDQAFSFDGTGDQVLVAPLSDTVRELQHLTVATWVKLDDGYGLGNDTQRFVTLGGEKVVLRQEGGSLVNRMLHFYMNFGTLEDDPYYLEAIRVNNAFQTGCWHYFAGTYDGQDMVAYLDGVEVGRNPVPGGTVVIGDSYAKLGAAGGPTPGDVGEELHGALDEVMIFDRALTATEIQEIYDSGGALKCTPGINITTGQAAVDAISGSYHTWFEGTHSYYGSGLFLSVQSFMQTSPWANVGMREYGSLPRIAIVNDVSDPYYDEFSRPWKYSFNVLSMVSNGLRALEDPDIQDDLTADELSRARAFGKYVLGLAHATMAMVYDQGFILDETTDLMTPPVPLPYDQVMYAALGYFDEAIALSAGASWTLPMEWMRAELTGPELARAAHSLKARFRAGVARNATERAMVDWSSVVADVDAGITSDLMANYDPLAGWYLMVLDYGTYPTWSQLGYFIYGMADQSGRFQMWDAVDLEDKLPYPDPLLGGDTILIVTPDQRFPQGATVATQQANPGSYFRIMEPSEVGNTWKRPDRGTWRWSWYKIVRGTEYDEFNVFDQPEIRLEEMRLLKAEGLYRASDFAGAASIINETREAAGLDPTDALGTNASCVPKLPNGACGDLFEMLKWEKRMETTFTGLMANNWFWDSRGWGDLWKDTPLQHPVPCDEVLELGWGVCTTYGGPGGLMSAPLSTYAWHDEGS